MAFEYEVALQVWHPSADSSDIIQQIGRTAGASYAAGEQRRSLSGSPLEGVYRESYCLFRLGDGEDGDLARFLEARVAELAPLKPVFAQLRATGGKIMFGILWTEGSTGEVFDVDLLAGIANLGVDLGIEVMGAR